MRIRGKKMAKKPTVNVEHVAKQKKRKDLSNEYVYCSIDGVVEMHPVSRVTINGKKLGDIVSNFEKEIQTLNERLETFKEINKGFNKRIKIIEGKLKKHGLE